jgi:hypothetical protein
VSNQDLRDLTDNELLQLKWTMDEDPCGPLNREEYDEVCDEIHRRYAERMKKEQE